MPIVFEISFQRGGEHTPPTILFGGKPVQKDKRITNVLYNLPRSLQNRLKTTRGKNTESVIREARGNPDWQFYFIF